MCDFRPFCPLAGGEPALPGHHARLFQLTYCDGEYRHCARYKVAKLKGVHHVPEDLMPDQSTRLSILPAGLV